jgi:hypothetical protein
MALIDELSSTYVPRHDGIRETDIRQASIDHRRRHDGDSAARDRHAAGGGTHRHEHMSTVGKAAEAQEQQRV